MNNIWSEKRHEYQNRNEANIGRGKFLKYFEIALSKF